MPPPESSPLSGQDSEQCPKEASEEASEEAKHSDSYHPSLSSSPVQGGATGAASTLTPDLGQLCHGSPPKKARGLGPKSLVFDEEPASAPG